MYALVESALAHAAGHDPDRPAPGHGRASWTRFNAVAAANPLSWFPTRRDGDEIITVTARQPDDLLPLSEVPERRHGRRHGRRRPRHRRGHGPRAGASAPDEVAYIGGWADAHEVWYLSERARAADRPRSGRVRRPRP